MLLPYLSILNKKKIILGSQSKSRNKVLSTQNLKYQCISSKFAEDLDKNLFSTPEKYNMETCKGKVNDLLTSFKESNKQWDLLICGDTILWFKGKIIEKPINKKDCVEMMSSLANETHQSLTSHIITFNTNPQIQYEWITKSDVVFGNIPIQCLSLYSQQNEAYTHSGGYELSQISGSFINEIHGSFTSVQGLDLHELCRKIIEGAKQAKWIE